MKKFLLGSFIAGVCCVSQVSSAPEYSYSCLLLSEMDIKCSEVAQTAKPYLKPVYDKEWGKFVGEPHFYFTVTTALYQNNASSMSVVVSHFELADDGENMWRRPRSSQAQQGYSNSYKTTEDRKKRVLNGIINASINLAR
ncbi:MAG: hypothetical protein R8M14_07475 [Ghiorsea sp.]